MILKVTVAHKTIFDKEKIRSTVGVVPEKKDKVSTVMRKSGNY